MRNTIKALCIVCAVFVLVSCGNLNTKSVDNTDGMGSLTIALPFGNAARKAGPSFTVSPEDVGEYSVYLYNPNSNEPGRSQRATPENNIVTFTNLEPGTYQLSLSGYQKEAGPSGQKLVIAYGHTDSNNPITIVDYETTAVEIAMEPCCEWRFMVLTGDALRPSTGFGYLHTVGGEYAQTDAYLESAVFDQGRDYSTAVIDGQTYYFCGWTRDKQYDAMNDSNYASVMAQITSDNATIYQPGEALDLDAPAVYYGVYCTDSSSHKLTKVVFKNNFTSEYDYGDRATEVTSYLLPDITTMTLPNPDRIFRGAIGYHYYGSDSLYWAKEGQDFTAFPRDNPPSYTVKAWGYDITLADFYSDATNKIVTLEVALKQQVGQIYYGSTTTCLDDYFTNNDGKTLDINGTALQNLGFSISDGAEVEWSLNGTSYTSAAITVNYNCGQSFWLDVRNRD